MIPFRLLSAFLLLGGIAMIVFPEIVTKNIMVQFVHEGLAGKEDPEEMRLSRMEEIALIRVIGVAQLSAIPLLFGSSYPTTFFLSCFVSAALLAYHIVTKELFVAYSWVVVGIYVVFGLSVLKQKKKSSSKPAPWSSVQKFLRYFWIIFDLASIFVFILAPDLAVLLYFNNQMHASTPHVHALLYLFSVIDLGVVALMFSTNSKKVMFPFFLIIFIGFAGTYFTTGVFTTLFIPVLVLLAFSAFAFFK